MLTLRAVVDQQLLYDMREGEPLLISFTSPTAKIFVTNGFHASATTELPHAAGSTYFFHVEALVGNAAMIAMLAASVLFFAGYAITGQGFILLLANLPILALVAVFFLFPSRCIVLKSWQPDQSAQPDKY